MKIMLAVPCMDQVPVPFCQSLAMLQKVGECTLAMKAGSLIYTSRNDLATNAVQSDLDYVFWMDSDMSFPPDTLVRMMDTLQKHDLDILTGLYFRRVPPYSPVLFDQLDHFVVECSLMRILLGGNVIQYLCQVRMGLLEVTGPSGIFADIRNFVANDFG